MDDREHLTVRFGPEDSVALPEPGLYSAVVDSVMPAKASTGKDGVWVKFTITDGEFQGSEAWDLFILSGRHEGVRVAKRRLRGLFETAGIPVKVDTDISLDLLRGKELVIRTELQEFEGQTRARVKGYRTVASMLGTKKTDQAPF